MFWLNIIFLILGNMTRHDFPYNGTTCVLDEIEIDPKLYAQHNGMIANFSDEKEPRFQITTYQNQTLYYSLKKMPKYPFTIVFGSPTDIPEKARHKRIIRLIPSCRKLKKYLRPNPLSWEDVSNSRRKSVKQDYKFMLRNNSQSREFRFHELGDETMNLLQQPQLNRVLEDIEKPITFFKSMLTSEQTMGGIYRRWLQVGEFTGVEENCRYLIVNVRAFWTERQPVETSDDTEDIKSILRRVCNEIMPKEKGK